MNKKNSPKQIQNFARLSGIRSSLMAKKVEPKEEHKPSLKALTLEGVTVEKLAAANQEGVLIDGGTTRGSC